MSGDTVTDAELAHEILPPLKRFELVCKLYPCVPLLKPIDLRRAYIALIASDAEGIRAVDKDGNDAGAFWLYWMTDKPLDKLRIIDYTLDVSQDINTYADIQEAERKYDKNRKKTT
jgi:hypothetical protein